MRPTATSLLERLRDTIELLESLAADRSVLEHVPDEDRTRLLRAVANLYDPDRIERRRLRKITARDRKAARVRHDVVQDGCLAAASPEGTNGDAATGVRACARDGVVGRSVRGDDEVTAVLSDLAAAYARGVVDCGRYDLARLCSRSGPGCGGAGRSAARATWRCC